MGCRGRQADEAKKKQLGLDNKEGWKTEINFYEPVSLSISRRQW
jgi:hypothetical protein